MSQVRRGKASHAGKEPSCTTDCAPRSSSSSVSDKPKSAAEAGSAWGKPKEASSLRNQVPVSTSAPNGAPKAKAPAKAPVNIAALAARKLGAFVPNKIFVGGVPNTCTEEQFKSYFEPFGPITKVELHALRGFGYITYESVEAVDACLEKYEDHYLCKRWVEVKRSIPRELIDSYEREQRRLHAECAAANEAVDGVGAAAASGSAALAPGPGPGPAASKKNTSAAGSGGCGWGASKEPPGGASRIKQLREMGFSEEVAKRVLSECVWDVNKAIDRLLSDMQLPTERSDLIGESAEIGAEEFSISPPTDNPPAVASAPSPAWGKAATRPSAWGKAPSVVGCHVVESSLPTLSSACGKTPAVGVASTKSASTWGKLAPTAVADASPMDEPTEVAACPTSVAMVAEFGVSQDQVEADSVDVTDETVQPEGPKGSSSDHQAKERGTKCSSSFPPAVAQSVPTSSASLAGPGVACDEMLEGSSALPALFSTHTQNEASLDSALASPVVVGPSVAIEAVPAGPPPPQQSPSQGQLGGVAGTTGVSPSEADDQREAVNEEPELLVTATAPESAAPTADIAAEGCANAGLVEEGQAPLPCPGAAYSDDQNRTTPPKRIERAMRLWDAEDQSQLSVAERDFVNVWVETGTVHGWIHAEKRSSGDKRQGWLPRCVLQQLPEQQRWMSTRQQWKAMDDSQCNVDEGSMVIVWLSSRTPEGWTYAEAEDATTGKTKPGWLPVFCLEWNDV
eukprot:TRINITY_DN17400_c0_g1_i1.p1 TRINITY_DN17400_c0_g1~~TRINITY_DN17400_c0_g1_i1.p1  ORF type:complete len:738 (-),score=139.77 TRINITY_DN17400_c0_g1_i1:172-2385(-)